MRVLVVEHFSPGHCYQYIHYLLPRLIEEVDEVVVAITAKGRETAEFATLLQPFEDRVRFDAFMVGRDWTHISRFHHGLELLANLRKAVRRARPDHVLMTTSDQMLEAMALYRLMGRRPIPCGATAEMCVHGGPLRPAVPGLKGRIGDARFKLPVGLAPAKIRMINALSYEWLRDQGGELGRRVSLMPHPVPQPPRLSKEECRRRLGLPEGGRMIGLVAELDFRKAIGQMLAAFRAGAPRPDDRLLLAGRIAWFHREVIDRDYADLIAEGRLILMDGYLDQDTFELIPQALDVVGIPYPGFQNLSSAMLHGIAAGRPVLAHDSGWMRMMIRRFGFGWTCDVMDHGSFTEAVKVAFERSGEYQETEATRRLLEFHHPDNFAETWVEGIREHMGKPASERWRTWDWVLEALDEDRRHLT